MATRNLSGGRYDDILERLLPETGGSSVVLIVINGKHGTDTSVHIIEHDLQQLRRETEKLRTRIPAAFHALATLVDRRHATAARN